MNVLTGLYIASALALCSCSMDGMVGSGKIVTQDRTVAAFSGVVSDGSMDVVIGQGAETRVQVKADDNLMNNVHTTVADGVLTLDMQGSISDAHITILVTSPTLNRIVLEGSGNVTVSNVRTGTISTSVEGSGDMTIDNATADTINTAIEGSGDMHVKGTFTKLTANLDGSGSLHAFDAPAQDVTLTIDGSGSAEVYATASLKAVLSGSGNVIYDGNPTVRIDRSGSGTDQRRK